MAGALKTLFGALQASTFLTGVTLVFGEEEVHDTAQPLPMVVMVPMGGPFVDSPGYSRNLDVAVEQQWGVNESIDLYLWAMDTNPLAQPIDHADRIESLRANVLAALQDQRAQYTDFINIAHGLWFKPIQQRWQQMQGGYIRLGRALVITVISEIPIAMPVPPEATITSTQINKTLILGPSNG